MRSGGCSVDALKELGIIHPATILQVVFAGLWYFIFEQEFIDRKNGHGCASKTKVKNIKAWY